MPTCCRHCDAPLAWWERVSGITQCAACFETFKNQPSRTCEQLHPVPEQPEAGVVQYPVLQTRLWGLSALTQHFAYLAGLQRTKFLVWVTLELLVAINLVAGLISLLRLPPGKDMTQHGNVMLLVFGILIAPPLETFLIQVPLGELTRYLKLGFWWQVLAMTLLFALAHFTNGLGSVLCAGLVGGFFFSLTYAARRNRSFCEAYWMTTLLHLLNNAVAIPLLILSKNQGT